jgi:hypothetical protein
MFRRGKDFFKGRKEGIEKLGGDPGIEKKVCRGPLTNRGSHDLA